MNHGDTLISENDILQAKATYSDFAFRSLVDETKVHYQEIEEVLIELAGSREIISITDIRNAMKRAKVPVDMETRLLDLLIQYTFLGLETRAEEFEFLHSERRGPVLRNSSTCIRDV